MDSDLYDRRAQLSELLAETAVLKMEVAAYREEERILQENGIAIPAPLTARISELVSQVLLREKAALRG
jgi:hypothetical protein